MSKFIKLTDSNGDPMIVDKNQISHVEKFTPEAYMGKNKAKCKTQLVLKRSKARALYVRETVNDVYKQLEEPRETE